MSPTGLLMKFVTLSGVKHLYQSLNFTMTLDGSELKFRVETAVLIFEL